MAIIQRKRRFFDRYADYPKPLRKGKYPFILCMISLGVLSFAVFYVGINLQSILLAFQRFEGYAPNGDPVYSWTTENFQNIFRELSGNGSSSTQLLTALLNTLFLYVFGNVVTIPMGFFISYYFWKKMRGYRFFRVVIYLPHIISSVVMVILYKNIIAPNGLIGAISIKLTGETVPPWLYQDGSAIWAVWIYNTWMGFGGDFLLLTAALTRIPEEVIESAQLDGITPFKEYFKICIPLIWPTLHIILLQKIAAILAADGPILLLTNGNNNTYTLGFWSYMQVIVGHSYEFPSAVGILMTAAVAPIAITSRKLLSKVYQDVEY